MSEVERVKLSFLVTRNSGNDFEGAPVLEASKLTCPPPRPSESRYKVDALDLFRRPSAFPLDMKKGFARTVVASWPRNEKRELDELTVAGRTKVAIIGGGCASIAAAFELSRPEHNGKYDITVYQLGWRLGGKGASGRGAAARIEEHGLHFWMGCYENAFRLMRECYSELGRDPRKCRIAGWRDAFSPAPFIALAQEASEDRHRTFLSYFPPDDSLPGDPMTEQDNPFSVTSYLVRTASLLRTILLTIEIAPETRADHRRSRSHRQPQNNATVEDVSVRIGRLLKLGAIASTAGLIEALGILELAFHALLPTASELVLQLLETLAIVTRRQLENTLDEDPQLLLAWQALDLGIAGMLGIIRFGLVSDARGFDAINDYDFREWMRLNGASERSLQSPLVRGGYDLAFGYEDGDYKRPSHGAGVMMRGSLRMLFGSRGSIFWKMRAGMGDVVFAPFYEVLRNRGVSFEFFHRLERVRLASPGAPGSGERPHVHALEFDLQAKVKQGEYHPLFDVDGLPCWPSKPDYSQLDDGAQLEEEGRAFESHWDRRRVGTRTLLASRDFDLVVLGVGFGAVPYVCQDLIKRDRRWRDLAKHLKTVETQAFQLWMREDMPSLGWNNPPVALSAFVQPFETWADMGHLIEEERWSSRPRAIAYFCSTLPSPSKPPEASDADYPARRHSEVRANAIRFLNDQIEKLWPKAAHRKGGFRWDTLIDPNEERSSRKSSHKGEARFGSQYWRANVNPTDRYVLSLPGTQKYRISPLDNTYDNLTVAGDWTACGLDSGCVESAVISGRLAAHAISSLPKLEDIVAYDHP